MKKALAAVLLLITVFDLTACQTPSQSYFVPGAYENIITQDWGWKKDRGNAENLSKAAEAIRAQRYYTFSGSGINLFIDAIQPILQENDVFLYMIVIERTAYWDSFDENGKFYSGTSQDTTVVLRAQDQEAVISGLRITYGSKSSDFT